MSKEIFCHNSHDSANRVTVCGIFYPEKNQLHLSGIQLERTRFTRKLGRASAYERTKVRPLIKVQITPNGKNTTPIQQAYREFRILSKQLMGILGGEGVEVLNLMVPKTAPHVKVKKAPNNPKVVALRKEEEVAIA
jgi:hypothetical protein